MALVGVLQRTDLECVECLCDCLDVCVGTEAVAGLLSGDTESPEADVEDDYLKLLSMLRAEDIFSAVVPDACGEVEVSGYTSVGTGE